MKLGDFMAQWPDSEVGMDEASRQSRSEDALSDLCKIASADCDEMKRAILESDAK